ncbi:hypothetical protein L1987_68031 [Smallanthus sonchifolius]|uniref:Uncharacterized protein n=1 Tax=Smallanthus sonchifolius TaxID=185202 RepID=A0ACB9B2Z3_9ASTR|nr:hypothetical protein L1987_68031 [Smallanthus sonchifolius]
MVSRNPINPSSTPSPLHFSPLSLSHTPTKNTQICKKAFEKIKQKLDFDGYDEDFDFNWLILSAVCGGVLFFLFMAVDCEGILTSTNPHCEIELFKELV